VNFYSHSITLFGLHLYPRPSPTHFILKMALAWPSETLATHQG